jgi:hypothetical protein
MQTATQSQPLQLKTRSEDWSAAYYDPTSPKCAERKLFVQQRGGAP